MVLGLSSPSSSSYSSQEEDTGSSSSTPHAHHFLSTFSQDGAAANTAHNEPSAAPGNKATAAVRLTANSAAEKQRGIETKEQVAVSSINKSPSVSETTPSCSPSSSLSSCLRPEAACDLKDVICSINMDIDFRQMARDQPLDPEYARLAQDARTSLHFRKVDMDGFQLIVDTSNGPARPWVPLAWRRQVFDAIHGLGHPGVDRTR